MNKVNSVMKISLITAIFAFILYLLIKLLFMPRFEAIPPKILMLPSETELYLLTTMNPNDDIIFSKKNILMTNYRHFGELYEIDDCSSAAQLQYIKHKRFDDLKKNIKLEELLDALVIYDMDPKYEVYYIYNYMFVDLKSLQIKLSAFSYTLNEDNINVKLDISSVIAEAKKYIKGEECSEEFMNFISWSNSHVEDINAYTLRFQFYLQKMGRSYTTIPLCEISQLLKYSDSHYDKYEEYYD